MKSKFLILIMILTIQIIGCSQEQDVKVIESNTWKNVVNQEWSEGGSGFYFHEDHGIAYCTYMIYGSGVRVARHYTSLVSINDEGDILISLPDHMSSPDFNGIKNADIVEVVLSLEDNVLKYENYKFEVHEGVKNYQYIVDDTE